MLKAFDPKTTYIQLSDSNQAAEVEVTVDFWEKIDSRADLQEGRLITTFHQSEDWTSWERHPAGEEVIILLSGECEFVVETPGGKEETVRMGAGQAFIIPQNYWHTVRVLVPGDIMVITRGNGTEHRPI